MSTKQQYKQHNVVGLIALYSTFPFGQFRRWADEHINTGTGARSVQLRRVWSISGRRGSRCDGQPAVQ